MKFRMAKNSLFAILLRSPWWISFAVAAALGVAAAALLPGDYKVLGALSAAPFIVIGVIALARQWRLPSGARVAQTQEAVGAMGWPAFSALLEEAFRRDGYVVDRSARAPVDFSLTRQGRRTIVCARRWKSARTGLEALRALQDARDTNEASEAIHICLGELTDNARPYATEHGLTIWQAAELARVLRGVPLAAPRG